MSAQVEILVPARERTALEIIKISRLHTWSVVRQRFGWLSLWTVASVLVLEALLKLNQFGLSRMIGFFRTLDPSSIQQFNDFERDMYVGFSGTILAILLVYRVMRSSSGFSQLKFVTPLMACLLSLTAGFIYVLLSGVGLLFFIIPGIYIYGACQFGIVLVMFQGHTPAQAVKLSWQAVHLPTVSRQNGLFGANFKIAFMLMLVIALFQGALSGISYCSEYLFKNSSLHALLQDQTFIFFRGVASSLFATLGGLLNYFVGAEFCADIVKFSPVGQFLRQRSHDTEQA